MSRTSAHTLSSIGTTLLTIEIRPKVPSTALNPSTNGIPAATTAPKAKSRMMRVSGSENRPAVFRSSSNESCSALSVLSPKEPT